MNEVDAHRVRRSAMTMLGLSIPLVLFGVWALYTDRMDHLGWITQPTPLIVKNSGVTAFYFGLIGILALVGFGVMYLFVGLNRRRPAWTARVERVGVSLVFVGIAGMLIGRPFINDYWAEKLSAAGYTECAGQGFALTGHLFREVWVRQPAACADDHFATMMRHHAYSREQIVTYVEGLGAKDLK